MPEGQHYCISPDDTVHAAFGSAVSRCVEAVDGTFWVDNSDNTGNIEYATAVRFCPFCGATATAWLGREATPPPELVRD